MTSSSAVSAAKNVQNPPPRPPAEKDEGRFKRTLKAAAPKTEVNSKPNVAQRVEQPLPKTETKVAQANIVPPGFPGVQGLPPGAEVFNIRPKQGGGWSYEVRLGGGSNAGEKRSAETPVVGQKEPTTGGTSTEGDVRVWDKSILAPSANQDPVKEFLGRPEWAKLGIDVTPETPKMITNAWELITTLPEGIMNSPMLKKHPNEWPQHLWKSWTGNDVISPPISNALTPGGELLNTSGLIERNRGVFFDASANAVAPADLPFFKPATVGILNGGRVESVINMQGGLRLPVVDQLPVGSSFKKGDVLFTLDDPALRASREQFQSRLGQIERDISVSLERAPAQIAALDERIGAVTEQIRLQETKISSLSSEVDRLRAGQNEGAISKNMLAGAERNLASSRQELQGLNGQLAQLRAQRKEAGEFAAINPAKVLEAARNGNTKALASLPPETRALANDYLRTTQQLADVKTREAANIIRAPMDGVVVGNFLGRTTGLDGQNLGINQTPGSQAEAGNYGTFAIAPRADAKAVASVFGIPPEVKVKPGDTLPIESSQFGVGKLKVTNVIDRGRNLGVEVQGTPIFNTPTGERAATVGDLKAPVRVALQNYDDLAKKGIIVRPDASQAPLVVRRDIASSPNVTFGRPTESEFKVNQFPTRDQSVQIRVPVTVDAAGAPGTVKQVGTITVEAKVSSDGNKLVPKGDAVAIFQPSDRQGSATVIPVDIVPVATANLGGSPQSDSGFEIRVRGQFTPKVTEEMKGGTVELKPIGIGGSVSGTDVPVAARQLPVLYSIQFGASGRRTGDDPIATVMAPSMVNVSRLSDQK
jgi:hypothetical protein